jgi:hypothetical protein
MTDAPLDITTILARIQDHALTSGWFDAVNSEEPKSPPDTTGVTCAVWIEKIDPALAASGLDSTSVRLEFTVRLYAGLYTEPGDAIDPNLTLALDALMRSYSGDFTLDGTVRQVDLLGAFGQALSSRAGYMIQGGTDFRVQTICLPLIVSDLWDQEA